MPKDTESRGGFDSPPEEVKDLDDCQSGGSEEVEPEEFFDDVTVIE
jgi:hypothetical protein